MLALAAAAASVILRSVTERTIEWTAMVLQDPSSHLGPLPHLNLVRLCYAPLNQTLSPPHPTFPTFSAVHKASLCSCTVLLLLLRLLQLNVEMEIHIV